VNNAIKLNTISVLTRSHIINSILNRKLFVYGTRNLLHYFVACVCLRRTRDLAKSKHLSKHYRLLQSKEKLSRELDVVKILKTIRDVHIIKKNTLRSHDWMLMNF